MLKNLWKYSKGERWKIIIYLIFHIISMFGELGKPLIFALIINTLQKNEENMISKIIIFSICYGGCFLFFEIFHRSARFIERYVAFRTRKRFIISIYNHIYSLSLSWHNDNHSGAIIDRINKAASAILEFGQSQDDYIKVIMTFIVPMVSLWSLSPLIALVATIVGVLMLFVTYKLYKLSVPEYRLENEGYHNVASALHDYISNITTIIMLRLGKYVKKDIESRIDRIFPHMVFENKITHLKCFISGFMVISLEIFVIVYYIISSYNKDGIIIIGSLTALFEYTKIYMTAFQYYTSSYENVIHWKTDFEAVLPIINNTIKENLNCTLLNENFNKIKVNIPEFFYKNTNKGIEDVNISLMKGKKIALVGESGSGKSTLLKILRGIIDCKKCSIIVDNKKLDLKSNLSNISTLIPQEAEIFENTIEYNINMGISNVNTKVDEVIKLSVLEDVIDRLPKKLKSDVREKGVNLSGGEKQRLALARGIFSINDSNLILLDEPTSNVDPGIEMDIFNNLFEKYKNQCIVASMHRLHITQKFDYIYVFKNGKIVEEGTFKELSSKKGEFNRLWEKYLINEI
jgi:ABC-type multidrug transport system fused ATPase/permease subunit